MMILLLLCSVLFTLSESQPQAGYVFNACTQNNNLNFTESPGGTLYWSEKDRNNSYNDHDNMNGSYIYNCLIVLRGKSQGSFPYKRFFGIHFRLWNFDTGTSRSPKVPLTPYYPNISSNIESVCGTACATGCMQLIHPDNSAVVTLCGSNQLTGTDYKQYFEQDYIMLRFFLLGGFYNSTDNNTYTVMNRPSVSFKIDFFSFYFGKCIDSTQEFQCIYTDRCIDITLKCDIYGGMDCGTDSVGGTTTYDQSVCTLTSSTATSNSNLFLLLLLLMPFFIMGLIWLFYRPGICCWRCARLRNCKPCNKQCNKCIFPCVLGNVSTQCSCCKSPPKFQKLSAASGKCATCVMFCGMCCCKKDDNNSITNLDNKNKISPYNSHVINTNFDDLNWTNYSLGDGYHLRECR